MFANLNGWHAVIVIAIILLLFGAPKIPQLARSLGQSMRILKTEIRDDGSGAPSDTPVAAPAEERAAK
ncbi:twin-arginine translocase TatA/TatE family subunit [Agromyces humi]|jgi:sec-independent protein translocase protein TatA|uniref:twin-arginine translocase TatA/TatE family subunit n=1 Tax=Agromyces humi TaxID=1766800 RepID=UPI001356A5CA|nr:twin-arginine translocase TatA/TatE family subunit [Agromyces humi]